MGPPTGRGLGEVALIPQGCSRHGGVEGLCGLSHQSWCVSSDLTLPHTPQQASGLPAPSVPSAVPVIITATADLHRVQTFTCARQRIFHRNLMRQLL